jgi:hypothetical protein
MAYRIFLKKLRILEEFRTNLHIKIPPKYPCQNFQNLLKIPKTVFYYERFSSSPFGLVGLADQSSCMAHVAQLARGDALSSSLSSTECRRLPAHVAAPRRPSAHLHSMVNRPMVNPTFNDPP